MIEIKEITKSFDGNIVLNKISFNIKKNEPVFIMGKSGKGKTTLINIITGLKKADSGEITGLDNLKKSLVFQEDRLCENISSVKNIKIACPHISDETAKQALTEMGFSKEDLIKSVKNLSGGMKRRTALARCLLHGGDFIIMDEAFKGLDSITKDICVDFVKKHIKDKYVLIVTHSEDDFFKIGGKIIKL